MKTLFLSALGAALGGFLGVIGFFFVRLWLIKRRTKPKLIREYLCGNDRNKGQSTESEGELMHHHGKRIEDKTELEKINAAYPVWEWTRTPTGKNKGASTIYGPYSTDFSKPGTYSAVFRIKATGLSHPNDIIDDLILLNLDVNKIRQEYLSTNQGISLVGAQYRNAIRYVRASELAQKDWVEFELKFYSDAGGVWNIELLQTMV